MFEIVPEKIDEIAPPQDAYFMACVEFCKDWGRNTPTFLRHTSGSTGTPKAIVLTRTQMVASARMTAKALGLRPQQISLICLNVNYIAGTMMLVRGMEIGQKMLVTAPANDPLANIAVSQTIDFMAVAPLQLQTMLQNHAIARLNAIGCVIVGGAAVSSTLEEAIRQLDVPIYATYGMTETVSHIALRRLNAIERCPFFEVLEGIEVGQDERQCLKICGAVTNHQWVQTNDVVHWHGERHFEVIGRADNIINSGGIKISLEKVERAIDTLKLPSRFFCWYKPDELLGQKLVLIVEGTPIPSLLELIKTTAQLSRYELPKEVFFVEKFTETPTQKIDKKRNAAAVL